jgi:lipopolysaccharide transport system permease protein
MTSSGTSWALPRRFVHRRDLLRELVVRDMKLRYKRSYLGVAWTLVNPLAQLLVFDFVFRVLFKVETPNYTAFLFIGITSWNWFSASVIESTGAILQNKSLISQPGFPAALLPNVTVGSNLVHFLLTFPILFGMVLVLGIPITGAIVWLPIVILVQYVLTLSFSLLGACLHVNFRDTQYLLSIFLMLGFFLTPILYEMSIVPERYHPIYAVNPMAVVVDAYRAILIRGEMPELVSLSTVFTVSLVLFFLFYLFFRRASFGFVEQL